MSTRTCIHQAAAIPCRLSPKGGIHVLLITTSAGHWGVPKGHVERGETDDMTAVREAIEEAGVLGTIVLPRLGQYRYSRSEVPHRVSVFALMVEEVLSRWPERGRRRRAWVTLRESQRLVAQPALRHLLRDLDAPFLEQRHGVLRRAV